MDHGILNVPLSKRGNIDAQIDKHKASLKALEKERSKAFNAERARATAMLAGFDDAKIKRLADGAKITVVQARKRLKSMAYFEPHKILALEK